MDICFCLLAAVHNAFMNMDVQTCLEILLSVLFNKRQEVVLLGHMVIQFFFLKNTIMFLTAAAPFYIPTSTYYFQVF